MTNFLFQPFESQFHSLQAPADRGSNIADDPSPDINNFRLQGRHEFERLGWPSRHLESWHYYDLSLWIQQNLHRRLQAPPPSVAPFYPNSLAALPTPENWLDLHFVDGKLQQDARPLPSGLTLIPLSDFKKNSLTPWGTQAQTLEKWSEIAVRSQAEHGGVVHLHQALFQHGCILFLDDHIPWEPMIRLRVSFSTPPPTLNSWTCLVILGENTRATLWEVLPSTTSEISSSWTHCEVGENAKLNWVRCHESSWRGVSLGLSTCSQFEQSKLNIINLVGRGEWVRETCLIDQEGEGAHLRWESLNLARNHQQIDLRTVVHHRKPKGLSQQLSRSLLAGASRTIFNGKILIAQDAQEVQAQQMSHSLMLHQQAEADSKPELEIYADNVKAHHGSTVGQLDKEQLYYLMSRGLRQDLATQFLLEGFSFSLLSALPLALQPLFKTWITNQLQDFAQQKDAP